MNRRHLFGQAVGASALALMPSSVRSQQTSEKVQIAGLPTEDATNLYYAAKTGMFTKAGLDVQIVNTPTGGAAVTGVITGAYEIGRTTLMPVMAAHLRGIGISVIGFSQLYDGKNPTALLQVPADSAVRAAIDLNDKIIGVPSLNELNAIASKAWMEKNGGNWRSAKFVEVPNGALVAALQQHRVDAAIVQSPQVFASIDAGTTRTLGDAWGAIAPHFVIAVYIARTDWVMTRRAMLRQLFGVYYEASGYVNAHRAETAQYVADLTQIDLAVVQGKNFRPSLHATALDPPLMQPVIDVAARYEAIPHAFPAGQLVVTL